MMIRTIILFMLFLSLSVSASDSVYDNNQITQARDNDKTMIIDSYYYKGDLIYLTRVADTNQTNQENNETNTTTHNPKTLTYIDENNNSLTISNRLIVKFKKRPDIKKIESDYNITAVKKMRKIYVFEVPDITEVLKTARLIYENKT